MPTSLVSTGVQFPDNSIQTTAATAAPVPGATAQYSVVGKSVNDYGAVATTMSNLAAGNVSVNNFLGVYTNGAGQYRSLGAPFWSSYYSRWFVLMASNSGTANGIFSSTNGLDWSQVIPDLASAIGISVNFVTTGSGAGAAALAVDESNGRFFYLYANTSSNSCNVAYSSLTSTNNLTGNWTIVVLRTGGGSFTTGALTYCKMSTTGASGLVTQFVDNDAVNSFIYTCPAGSTSFTLQLTMGINETAPVIFEENGKIFAPLTNTQKIAYNVSGNITSGWNQVNPSVSPSNQGVRGCVGNGYMVYVNGTSVYYSTNGTAWTAAATSISGNIVGVIYTGSVFIAWSETSTVVSSNNTPITWSLYSGGSINALRSLSFIKKPWSQRVVA